VDTPANIQVSGGQEPQSGDDAVCGLNKADKVCDTNQPINNSRVDKTEQECDQLDKWTTVVRKKRWCHNLAMHLMLSSRQWKFLSGKTETRY